MDEKYHPELYGSLLCDPETASKFRSIIGSINWIVTFKKFDVDFATMSLNKLNMAPKEGHLKGNNKNPRLSINNSKQNFAA